MRLSYAVIKEDSSYDVTQLYDESKYKDEDDQILTDIQNVLLANNYRIFGRLNKALWIILSSIDKGYYIDPQLVEHVKNRSTYTDAYNIHILR